MFLARRALNNHLQSFCTRTTKTHEAIGFSIYIVTQIIDKEQDNTTVRFSVNIEAHA